MKTVPNRYHPLLRVLHGSVALLLFALIAVGLYMTEVAKPPFKGELYGVHKSFGMLVLGLILLRVVVRQVTAIPPHNEAMPRWQKNAARGVHALLYPLMLSMPLSGYLMSVSAGYPVSFFGLAVPSLIGKDKHLHHFVADIHETAYWVLLAVVAVHVLAVIRHTLQGHSVWRRMWW
jgi:cytochrome b561